MDDLSSFGVNGAAGVKAQEQFNDRAELEQQVAQLEQAIKTMMTPEARARFANIKLASPGRAVDILMLLAQLIQSGKVKQIDDVTFKTILAKAQPQKKITIIRR